MSRPKSRSHKIGYEQGSLETPVEVHVIESPVFVPVPGPTVEPGPTIVTVKIPVQHCKPPAHRNPLPQCGGDIANWLNAREYRIDTEQAP